MRALALDGPLLLRAGLIVLVGGSGGLAANGLRKDGVSLTHFAQPTMCDEEEPGRAPEAPSEIDPTEASTMCGRPEVVIADARSAAAYAEGHIAGAVHLPCTATHDVAATAIGHLGGARTIIVYGESSEEARPVAASLQRRADKTEVRVLTGGFPAWSRAGLACASGPCDGCVRPR